MTQNELLQFTHDKNGMEMEHCEILSHGSEIFMIDRLIFRTENSRSMENWAIWICLSHQFESFFDMSPNQADFALLNVWVCAIVYCNCTGFGQSHPNGLTKIAILNHFERGLLFNPCEIRPIYLIAAMDCRWTAHCTRYINRCWCSTFLSDSSRACLWVDACKNV